MPREDDCGRSAAPPPPLTPVHDKYLHLVRKTPRQLKLATSMRREEHERSTTIPRIIYSWYLVYATEKCNKTEVVG